MNKEKVDVLVIGAGPSGTVAASIINQAGYSVKIVEKELFPRFVIGESLLPKCMEPLEAAGFLPALKAQGYQEKFGAKFVNSEQKVMDFNFSDQFTKGWSWTWQVPRANFDKVLADEVQKMGVPIEYETTVTAIQFDGSNSTTTVVAKNGTEKQIEARFIVDASGYGRVIPRLFKLDRPSNLPPRKALFTHIRDEKRNDYIEPNRILIIDHKPGVWAWCIPFSNGLTSCGFVSEPSFFDDFKGTPEEQLRSIIASEWSIADRFKDAEFIFEPRVLQAWSATTEKFYGDGFVLTGNVTEFLDPIFSSGVTLATVSSQLAANLTVRKLKGENVDWQKEYMDYMLMGVDTFRSYVMAWYDGTLQKIFFEEDRNLEVIRQICSVLAGYVWDQENPYVKNHDTYLTRMVRLINVGKKLKDLEESELQGS
ncbi:MAG: tryptophan 7-halogenase [Chitinophagales bacterium]|nr:tryptophan 7-halogenase [Chitinophagales bacterium]